MSTDAVDTSNQDAPEEATETGAAESGLATIVVDARPILASGGEPFDAIMDAAQKAQPGQVLEVWAPFEPVPLQGVLGEQGFAYESTEESPGTWLTRFTKD